MAGAYYKRELSGNVRDLALREIKAVLEDTENLKYGKDFRQQLVLRLAGSVLPRINEHTGEDGAPIPIMNITNALPSNNGDTKNSEANKED
jgi:hypothetical protein